MILLRPATNAVGCDQLDFFLFLLQHTALVAGCSRIAVVWTSLKGSYWHSRIGTALMLTRQEFFSTNEKIDDNNKHLLLVYYLREFVVSL